MRGGGKYQGLVCGFVIAWANRTGAKLGNDHGAPVGEAHHRRYVKAVLVEAGEEKCAVAAERTAQGEAELLLLIVRFEVHERMFRSEGTVADEIEIGSVEAIGTRFGDHIHYGATSSAQLGAVGVGGDAELLHYFVGKLIGGTIAATGLPKKRIVVVATIDQIAGLESANPSEGEVAV